MTTPVALKQKLARLWPHLDERGRRMVAATEALQLGHGGISQVSRACGLSRVTITKGIRELDAEPLPSGRVRRPGAGRPRLVTQDPGLPGALEGLVEPTAWGTAPLDWFEGLGLAEGLGPASLYEDQLARRLGRPRP